MSREVKFTVDELPLDIIEDVTYVINQPNPNSYTHGIFKYPCKFIPEIPRWAMRKYLKSKESKVLDPFSGSGTTLLEASINGYESIGAEIDEIAKLVTTVKTTKLNENEIKITKIIIDNIVSRLSTVSYGENEVILPRITNLDHWFKREILFDLGHVYYSIINVENKNIQNFLLVCLASIIKKVSNADDVSPKPYVSNNIKKNPPPVGKTFEDISNKYLSYVKTMCNINLNNVFLGGNATHILSNDNTVDIAITSPPYINAFDYVRTLRLENLWLHFSTEEKLREKKKIYIGTESIRTKEEKNDISILKESVLLSKYYDLVASVDEKRALIMKKFFEEMKKNLKEVYRVLKKDSYYIIVIGNSSIRKIEVESWRVLEVLAKNVGFTYENHIGYEIQNPYIRIPRGNKGGKIAIDHILVLKK